MLSRLTTTLIASLVVFAGRAWTEETGRPAIQKVAPETGAANSTNASNNPANPMIIVDLQNYFMPSPRGYLGNGCLINLYIEPQYSVYATGSTAARWQIYAGATLKFPIGKQQIER
jgi:hypothetical protein